MNHVGLLYLLLLFYQANYLYRHQQCSWQQADYYTQAELEVTNIFTTFMQFLDN
ncbi:hypothetical protein [Colwellia ponticola]|uniref:hypothetical protein n=1 Tax=Colwellia ponticola TaxID=2304625 RepID=UPI001485DBB6|nr:hypothetical protein [Colwellia ponticola]